MCSCICKCSFTYPEQWNLPKLYRTLCTNGFCHLNAGYFWNALFLGKLTALTTLSLCSSIRLTFPHDNNLLRRKRAISVPLNGIIFSLFSLYASQLFSHFPCATLPIYIDSYSLNHSLARSRQENIILFVRIVLFPFREQTFNVMQGSHDFHVPPQQRLSSASVTTLIVEKQRVKKS